MVIAAPHVDHLQPYPIAARHSSLTCDLRTIAAPTNRNAATATDDAARGLALQLRRRLNAGFGVRILLPQSTTGSHVMSAAAIGRARSST